MDFFEEAWYLGNVTECHQLHFEAYSVFETPNQFGQIPWGLIYRIYEKVHIGVD